MRRYFTHPMFMPKQCALREIREIIRAERYLDTPKTTDDAVTGGEKELVCILERIESVVNRELGVK